MWNGITQVGYDIARGVDGLIGIPEESPAKLGGASVRYENIIFFIMLGAIFIVVAIAGLIDLLCPNLLGKDGSPLWVLVWLVASYGLLIPGIVCVLFAFNIFASFSVDGVIVVNINLTKMDGKPSSVSESMLSLIQVLVKSGGVIGAILVIIYAIVIPFIKAVLLFLGECWRHGTEEKRALSRQMFMAVQVVSKWACPDMFAYILMLYLFRHMNHPPKLQTTARLEIGFISFSLFCLNSTFASLAIPLPALSTSEPFKEDLGKASTPWCVRTLGTVGVKLLAVVLSVVFFACGIIGIAFPCMAVKLDLGQLHIPAAVAQTLENLNFGALVGAEVSIWNCMLTLASWLRNLEAPLIMAFLLIAVFVVALPALDMISLLCTTFTHPSLTGSWNETSGRILKRLPVWGMTTSTYIKHVAMLDVFIMGVLVVCAAGSAYDKEGVNIMLRWGMYPLIAAELSHYAMYFLISSLRTD